jgi:hypothetical protein
MLHLHMSGISVDGDNDVDEDHDYATNYHSSWPHTGFANHEASYCPIQLYKNHLLYKKTVGSCNKIEPE